MTNDSDWKYPFDDIAQQEREQVDLSRRLDAIGVANKWLRKGLKTRLVSLVVGPGYTNETADLWFAYYLPLDMANMRTFTGQTWRIALSNAVFELLPDPVLNRFLASKDAWFIDAWHPAGYPLSEEKED